MSAEDVQSQSGFEDGLGGPGAPTPLSALEVHASVLPESLLSSWHSTGHQWVDTTRH